MSDFMTNFSAIMRAEIDMLDSVAQNAANTNTTGYRSERSALASTGFADSIRPENGSLSVKSVSEENGSLKVTQRNFDFAIMGQGWFSIEHEDGMRMTRNGSFSVNKDGVLVNGQGLSVMGESGQITEVYSNTEVRADGAILNDGEVVDHLAIVIATQNAHISAMGDGLYLADGVVEKATDYKIIQGALESSNVDTAADMVRLMTVTRHIESLQRAMSSYDDLMNTGINQIGK